jgi:K+-sensing histidine kinase KdpD
MNIPIDSESYAHLLDADKVVHQACNMVKELYNAAKDKVCETSKVCILKTLLKNSDYSSGTYSCELQISDDIWTVEVDEEQLGKVFSNLLSYVGSKQKEESNIKIIACNVAVQPDSGMSLVPGDYAKISLTYEKGAAEITDDFFQIGFSCNDNPVSNHKLALYVACSIIRNHSGTIQVYRSGQSEEGRIDIYLPASTHLIFSGKEN